MHRNGSSWTQAPSAPASAGEPIAVAATATDYAWLADSATGSEFAWPGGRVAGLWNGRDWTTVPIPLVQTHFEGRGGDVSALAVAGHVAWVAGTTAQPQQRAGTGSCCRCSCAGPAARGSSRPRRRTTSRSSAWAVLSSTSAWAVGYIHARTTLILHWNGSTWS